jgi:dihydroorotate dehydrogenase
MYSLIRPLLFRLDPDLSHDLAQWFFRRQTLWQTLSPIYAHEDPILETNLLGLTVQNPIGLAAGFDKNAQIAKSMMALGFGFVTVGSVMRNARKGNPKPRIARRSAEQALVNSMGLPSQGVKKIQDTLRTLNHDRPVIISIGGHSIEDYRVVMDNVSEFADAIEVNISCPNVEHGTEFAEDPHLFQELAQELASRKSKPILVKIPPYSIDEEEKMLEIISTCLRSRFEGISATNTLKVNEPKISMKQGGLSGKPLLRETNRIVRRIHQETDGKLAIIATGGVFDEWNAFDLICDGANAVSLYTAMIYRGPGVVRKLKTGIARLIRERKFHSLSEARGSRFRQ